MMCEGILVCIMLLVPVAPWKCSWAPASPASDASSTLDRDQLHREASELLRHGKFQEAVTQFEKIITRWPEFYPAYSSLGIAYTKLGKLEQAERFFLKAAQLNPNSAQVRNNLGANYLERKKSSEAAAEFQKATTLEPTNVSAWFNLGVCELHMAHSVRAEAALQKAAQLNPKDPQILATLAEAQFKTGKHKLALSSVNKVSELTGDDPKMLLSMAILLSRNGENDQASAYFKRAARSMPEISDRVLTLASSRIDQGDYRAALSFLEWVKDSEENSAAWHNMVGYSYFKLKQIEPSMHHLQEAIRLDPAHEDYYLDLGDLLGENNALLAAVAVFESGSKALPNSIKMRLGLAVAYLLTGNLDRVNQEINVVLARQPTSEIAYKILLESYGKGMQWPQMQDAAQRLRKVNGTNPLGWYYGAKCEYEMGVVTNSRLESALKFIERALELGPPDLKSYFLLGKILIAERREEEAVIALQKAIRLSSEDPRPFYVLARLLQRRGRNEEAKEVLNGQRVAKSKQDSSQFRRLLVEVR